MTDQMKTFMTHLEFIIKFDQDEQTHISPQLADQLPAMEFPENFYDTTRYRLITFYQAYFNMIMEIGDIEHTNDWDPAIIITLYDGTEHGNEPGFHTLIIQEDNIKLHIPDENGEDDGNQDYWMDIDIMKIRSIRYHFH